MARCETLDESPNGAVRGSANAAALQFTAHRSHNSRGWCARCRTACKCRCVARALVAAEYKCFSLLARVRRGCVRSLDAYWRTRVSIRTRLGLQLYLHTALAFPGKSLYRTRRFLSLSGAADRLDARAAHLKPGQKLRVLDTVWGIPSKAWPRDGIVSSKLDTSDYGASQSDPEHVTTKALRRHT